MSLTATYIILCALWAMYFALHSTLAANGVKSAIKGRFPGIVPYYRIIFNVIAVSGLVPLAWYTLSVNDVQFIDSRLMTIIGLVVLVAGVYTLNVAFRSFNTKEFLGLAEEHTQTGSTELVRSGMYKIVRHPLYFATIIIFLGLLLMMPTLKILLVDLVVFAYLVIGSKLEEVKLIEEFGDDYRTYQKEVKGLIPFVY